jgi:hypothetical protein
MSVFVVNGLGDNTISTGDTKFEFTSSSMEDEAKFGSADEDAS